MKMRMLTKSLQNPDNRIRLLNVLLGKGEGCSVPNLEDKAWGVKNLIVVETVWRDFYSFML